MNEAVATGNMRRRRWEGHKLPDESVSPSTASSSRREDQRSEVAMDSEAVGDKSGLVLSCLNQQQLDLDSIAKCRSSVVVDMVRDLYIEGVIPTRHLLQWIIKKAYGHHWRASVLLVACDEAHCLRVQPRSRNANFRISLADGVPDGFLGFVDGGGPFALEGVPDALWNVVRQKFCEGGWDFVIDEKFQAFELASWLQNEHMELMSLPFGRLLGFVKCGIMDDILGFREGRIVPWTESKACERLSHARLCKPMGIAPGQFYVCHWLHLRWCLKQLLRHHGYSLPVNDLKRSFRTFFQADLCETAFGYTSLKAMLRNKQLQDLLHIRKTDDCSFELASVDPNTCDDNLATIPLEQRTFAVVPPQVPPAKEALVVDDVT